MHFKTYERFFSHARELRKVFDAKFSDPLFAHQERFVWDYWHVPGEYTQLRTPAFQYFPRKLYEKFHRYLVLWGREHLGCHDISPPWLSCYVEGCRQEAHQDVPHGPLAFVFSLTDWNRRNFTGGETFLKLSARKNELIEPKFNRLTIFDPSLWHGVRQVHGTHDPRQGRLVMNGWFVNPRPFWFGPLSVSEVRDAIEGGVADILSEGFDLGHGFLSLKLEIAASGEVRKCRILINTLKEGLQDEQAAFIRSVAGLSFTKKRTPSSLILPLMIGQSHH